MEIEDAPQTPKESSKDIDTDKLNVKGLMCGVIGNLAFSLNSPILRMLMSHNSSFTPYEILYWQGLSMLFMNYFYVKYHGQHVLNVGPQYRKVIVFRSFIGFCGI